MFYQQDIVSNANIIGILLVVVLQYCQKFHGNVTMCSLMHEKHKCDLNKEQTHLAINSNN